jgi:tetratricopeptide (TPR) repeat protein
LRPVHYITIAAAIALTAFLYWGGNTTPPAKTGAAAMQQPPQMMGGTPGPNTVKPASFDSLLAASRKQLPKTVADTVATIENELKAIRDSAQMASVFLRLAHVWEVNKYAPIAAYFGARAAKLENSEKKLNFAGQFFLDLMHEDTSSAMHMWEAQEAVDCFKRSLAVNPNSDSTKMALAAGYIEGTGETMQGVQLLLSITREKPDNIPANMLLGKMAIQSGQFDKAQKRFEGILKLHPENAEAMYFLAEVYKSKGDKEKAVEWFEKCKKLVNRPEFSRDVDQYISTIK